MEMALYCIGFMMGGYSLRILQEIMRGKEF